MGSQGWRGRPRRRNPVTLPPRGAEGARRSVVPDLPRQGQPGAVPVLRTVPRRGRLQGAPGERAFQVLHRGASVAAAGTARADAIQFDLAETYFRELR